jgi:hypothetical protein
MRTPGAQRSEAVDAPAAGEVGQRVSTRDCAGCGHPFRPSPRGGRQAIYLRPACHQRAWRCAGAR